MQGDAAKLQHSARKSNERTAMPVINIALNDTDYQRLEKEHEAIRAAWPTHNPAMPPPTFAVWLGARLSEQGSNLEAVDSLADVRLFNAVEKLVTSLPAHGFQLAHVAPAETAPATSAQLLANAMVHHFSLQQHYIKRFQELFTHYLKTPKEIADTAHVGITNRAYGALTEAQRSLTAQTTAAIPRLGADRAIGRIEGATAMLVSLEVMNPATAKQHTSAFKAEARAQKKSGWVGKMFGER